MTRMTSSPARRKPAGADRCAGALFTYCDVVPFPLLPPVRIWVQGGPVESRPRPGLDLGSLQYAPTKCEVRREPGVIFEWMAMNGDERVYDDGGST